MRALFCNISLGRCFVRKVGNMCLNGAFAPHDYLPFSVFLFLWLEFQIFKCHGVPCHHKTTLIA